MQSAMGHQGYEKIPLVVVEGFLGGSLSGGWRNSIEVMINPTPSGLEESSGHRKLVFASVGPVSSLHDRACELYYALRGGTVDYGVDHCKVHNHARFGRMHPVGLYPGWCKERPLHFLGHSIGGSTIVKLQHLMQEGHFGDEAHPDMVLSVNSLSSPFRGTQLVYTLGESTHSAPAVRPLSIGALLTKAIHFFAYITPLHAPGGALSGWLPQPLDLHPESRELSYKDISFAQFLGHLWKSDWAESRDATPFDMTFEAADERDRRGEGLPFPNTFYQSHVFFMTSPITQNTELNTHHAPSSASWMTTNPLYLMSRSIGRFDFSVLKPVPSFCEPQNHQVEVEGGHKHTSTVELQSETLQQGPMKPLDETYWANDGVVPVFSQFHPFSCHPSRCFHEQSRNISHISPGRWVVRPLAENRSHFFLTLPTPTNTAAQAEFWKELSSDLVIIDSHFHRSKEST